MLQSFIKKIKACKDKLMDKLIASKNEQISSKDEHWLDFRVVDEVDQQYHILEAASTTKDKLEGWMRI